MFERAVELVRGADVLIVAGTSLAVYPAASLVRYVRPEVPVYLVDPGNPDTAWIRNPLTHIRERSAVGMPRLVRECARRSMPGRQGSSCASLCGGPAGGHNCASVGGPSSRSVCPDAARWDGPAGGEAR